MQHLDMEHSQLKDVVPKPGCYKDITGKGGVKISQIATIHPQD